MVFPKTGSTLEPLQEDGWVIYGPVAVYIEVHILDRFFVTDISMPYTTACINIPLVLQ